MRLRDFGAGVVFASINVLAALGAIPNRQPLQGVLEIRGFTIVDPPPHEPRDTHAAFVIKGDAARLLYETMKIDAVKDDCLADGSRRKQIGNLKCVHLMSGATYECDFAIDIEKQVVEVGRVCWCEQAGAVWIGRERFSERPAQGNTPNSQISDEAGGPPGASPNQTLDLIPLPEGEGYYSYSPPENQFGTPETIDVIQQAGKKASELGLPQFSVGDISKQGGGPFPPHASRQFGRDIDIRPLQTTGARGPVSVGQPLYSRDYTNQIIQIFRSDPRVGANYFNDTRIPGTTWGRGHDNHFHVRVLP
jgi:hypothetical protein